MDEDELLDAYHGAHPYSYGGQQRVQDFVNIDDGELKTVLSKSDIYMDYILYVLCVFYILNLFRYI